MIEDSPQLTIIVPVYNGSKYLIELLDSILKQTYTQWICLCVDDGSTDNSRELLSTYANKDTRFQLVYQKNSSCGNARNNALQLVKTPFVSFADQDDILHPKAFERALNAMNIVSVDCLHFNFILFTNKLSFPPIPNKDTIPHIEKRQGLNLITGKHDSWPIAVWSYIFRTEAIRKIPFPPISGGEDQAWMMELSWNRLMWASIPDTLYANRLQPHSQSRALSAQYIRNILNSYDWIRTRAKLYDVNLKELESHIKHMRRMFKLSVVYRNIRISLLKSLRDFIGSANKS